MKYSYCLHCRYGKEFVTHPACEGCLPVGNCEPTHYKEDNGMLSNNYKSSLQQIEAAERRIEKASNLCLDNVIINTKIQLLLGSLNIIKKDLRALILETGK